MPNTETMTAAEAQLRLAALRFWTKVNKSRSCWLWLGGGDGQGYGSFKYNGKTIRAHRFAYQICKGAIPKGLQIDHLCRNRICVNPDHLEVVVRRINILQGVGPTALHYNQDTCIHGHTFDAANTYFDVRRGRRQCRACRNRMCRALRQRRIKELTNG